MNRLRRKIRRWSKRTVIPAIPEDAREEVLQSLGLLEPLVNGVLKCEVCGTVVTLDNLAMFRVENGEFVFSCDTPSCMISFRISGVEVKDVSDD